MFWSPDSKQLGFAVGTVLKRISADGGPVQEIVHGHSRRRVVGRRRRRPLRGDRTGKCVASVHPEARSRSHDAPGPGLGAHLAQHAPDGRHFLFTAKHWAGLAEVGAQGIYLGSLDNPSDIRQLLPELSSAVYAPPGYVVFARDGQLMAAPFDLLAAASPVNQWRSLKPSQSMCRSTRRLVRGRQWHAGHPAAASACRLDRERAAGAFDAELTLHQARRQRGLALRWRADDSATTWRCRRMAGRSSCNCRTRARAPANCGASTSTPARGRR